MKFVKYTTTYSQEKVHLLSENPEFADLWRDITEKEEGIDNFDLLNERRFASFYILHEYQLEALHKLFVKTPIPLKLTDLSDYAINSFYACNDNDVQEAMQDEQFIMLVNKYVSKNSNRDIVLDKIGLHGLHSLTETEKSFLSGL